MKFNNIVGKMKLSTQNKSKMQIKHNNNSLSHTIMRLSLEFNFIYIHMGLYPGKVESPLQSSQIISSNKNTVSENPQQS